MMKALEMRMPAPITRWEIMREGARSHLGMITRLGQLSQEASGTAFPAVEMHAENERPHGAHSRRAPAASAGRTELSVQSREFAVRQGVRPSRGAGVRKPIRVKRQNERSKSPRQPRAE